MSDPIRKETPPLLPVPRNWAEPLRDIGTTPTKTEIQCFEMVFFCRGNYFASAFSDTYLSWWGPPPPKPPPSDSGWERPRLCWVSRWDRTRGSQTFALHSPRTTASPASRTCTWGSSIQSNEIQEPVQNFFKDFLSTYLENMLINKVFMSKMSSAGFPESSSNPSDSSLLEQIRIVTTIILKMRVINLKRIFVIRPQLQSVSINSSSDWDWARKWN